MLVIFQLKVVGRDSETQLQVGESFKVYPHLHPPTPFGKKTIILFKVFHLNLWYTEGHTVPNMP